MTIAAVPIIGKSHVVVPGEQRERIQLRIPKNWKLISKGSSGGVFQKGNVKAIITSEVHGDGRAWIHLSVSKKNSLPTYGDLKRAKKDFLGPESRAMLFFPPESEHVNLHKYCHHLWCCVDEDPLPDFPVGSGGG